MEFNFDLNIEINMFHNVRRQEYLFWGTKNNLCSGFEKALECEVEINGLS